jgi:hypothetical protein
LRHAAVVEGEALKVVRKDIDLRLPSSAMKAHALNPNDRLACA